MMVAVWPLPELTVTEAGVLPPTVTLDVASAKPGALARITVVPKPVAVTLKPMIWVEALSNNEDGTMATAVFEDDNVKVVLNATGAERVNSKVASDPTAVNVALAGERDALTPTVTRVEAGAIPTADAEIVAVPAARPIKFAPRLGVVWPALMVSPVVPITAFVASLLVS